MSQERSGLLDWLSERINLTEIVSLLTCYGFIYTELDTRKRLREAMAEAMDTPMPSYGIGPRILGLMMVILVLLEIVTGSLLAFYYLPTPESAHASVATLMRDVHFGAVVHRMHFWGAQLLLIVLLARLVRFLLQGVHRAPRELTWVFASLLLLVSFHAELTGRFLVWSSSAYWSGMRALEIASAIPVYGGLVRFLLGAEEAVLGDLTLLRSFLLHTAVLPVATIVLVYLHFSTIRRVGLLETRREPARPTESWLRLHMANLALVLTAMFGLVVSLAVLFPGRLGVPADPYQTATGVGPPWYLLAHFGFLELTSRWIPTWLAGTLLVLATLAFLLVPFYDRSADRGARRPFLIVAAIALAAWIGLSIYGAQVV